MTQIESQFVKGIRLRMGFYQVRGIFLGGATWNSFGLDFSGLVPQFESAFNRSSGNFKRLDNLRSWSSMINRMQDTLS